MKASWEGSVDKAEHMQRLSASGNSRGSTARRGSLEQQRKLSLSPAGSGGLNGGGGSRSSLSEVDLSLIEEESGGRNVGGGFVDPPKVYEKGSRAPGLKHTRALGEEIWQKRVGISPNGEVLRKDLREQDQFVILASDGVWEFVSNQAVCDRIMEFNDPRTRAHPRARPPARMHAIIVLRVVWCAPRDSAPPLC